MPPEGFDGIGKLFITTNGKEYVPLPGIKEYRELTEPEQDTREQLEQLEQSLREMREKLEARKEFDTILMNDNMMMDLLLRGFVREEGKEFRYDGLLVLTNPNIPYDKAYLTDYEHARMILDALETASTESTEIACKEEPKACHCRICGRTYYDKAEAKECARSHEWQNRRGRR